MKINKFNQIFESYDYEFETMFKSPNLSKEVNNFLDVFNSATEYQN